MTRPPPVSHLLAEAAVPWAWICGRMAWRALAAELPGDGRPVLVLPGFMTGDARTTTLRRMLVAAGYDAHGWGLGLNRGISVELLDALLARLAVVARDRPAALVGWSLGGLYAREIAKRMPDRVERVVTLGSPFSGDLRANHAWRLYGRVAGHAVDRLPIAAVLHQKPPVPTIALWTARDGIVAPAASRGLPGETDVAIAVACRHVGFTIHPAALRAVLEALRRPV